jgi:hypothetical protein
MAIEAELIDPFIIAGDEFRSSRAATRRPRSHWTNVTVASPWLYFNYNGTAGTTNRKMSTISRF